MFARRSSQRFVPDHVRRALGSDFNDQELAELDRLGTLVELRRDTKLTAEGTPGREAMVIVAGSATVVRDGRPIASVGPGEVIGEMALLSGEPRSASIYADTDMTVYALSGREFATLLARSPRLERTITRTALKRMVQAA